MPYRLRVSSFWAGQFALTVMAVGLPAGCDRPVCPSNVQAAPAETSSADPASARYQSTTPPGDLGELGVQTISLKACQEGAPVPLRVYVPKNPGVYAVVQFQHGFILDNRYYSRLLTHIASHGFVVVAPQMYPADGWPVGKPSTAQESEEIGRVLDWAADKLGSLTGTTPDFGSVALVGHSRGGKAIALFLASQPTRVQAFAGIDPVDGQGGPFGGEARAAAESSLFRGSTLIIGAGRSGACAPQDDNYTRFFEVAASPAWQVVLPEAGHTDILDANRSGCGLACLVCKPGSDPAASRQAIAGLVTAFLMGTLQGHPDDLAILSSPEQLVPGAQASRK